MCLNSLDIFRAPALIRIPAGTAGQASERVILSLAIAYSTAKLQGMELLCRKSSLQCAIDKQVYLEAHMHFSGKKNETGCSRKKWSEVARPKGAKPQP